MTDETARVQAIRTNQTRLRVLWPQEYERYLCREGAEVIDFLLEQNERLEAGIIDLVGAVEKYGKRWQLSENGHDLMLAASRARRLAAVST